MTIAALMLSAALLLAATPDTESDFESEEEGDVAQAEAEREQSSRRDLAANLAARADADSAATAAMIFETLNDRTAALEQAHRSGRLAPERADLAWLELQFCVETPACAPGMPARRLAALDPQNGVAFLHELPTAPEGRTPQEIAPLLKISQAERFDSYWAKLIITAHDAIERSERSIQQEKVSDRHSIAIEASGMVAAIAMPNFTQLMSACKGEAIEDSTRRDICLRIARALQRGDTVLAEALGIAIEKRLWPADSREAAALEARREELRKWQQSLGQLTADETWEKRFIGALRTYRSEREAGNAVLAQYRETGQNAVGPQYHSTLSAAAHDPLTDNSNPDRYAESTSSRPGRTTMPIEFLNVNFLAVLVAAVSSFVLGGLWYSRALFGLLWNREAGMKSDKPHHSPLVFVASFVLALVAAWLFAALLPAGISTTQATLLGTTVGLGWVATSFGINYGFGDRSLTLWLIDAGYHTLQFTLYGAIIGAWR